MIDVASLPSTAQAAVQVGAVLSEAIALYVGYGAVTSVLSPRVRRAIGGE
jgi:hypothetical protein